ncbi:unnamed protein product [Owenia fusiformis]|uniref:Claudin n=1 Tax=Owenia fusiformis TaxID=6347 RepID=A0A8S4Q4U8_OWEFU|nr:unnamed protein product [Owenia fusiformis]
MYSASVVYKKLETSWVIIVAMVCLVSANILSIVSFTTTGWRVTSMEFSPDTGENVQLWEGLWQVCRTHDSDLPSSCIYQDKIVGTGLTVREKYTPTNRQPPMWFRTVQGFAVIGLLCLIVSFLICLVYMCLVKTTKRKGPVVATAIFSIFGGGAWALAIVIFVTHFSNDVMFAYSLHYSFFLACISVGASVCGAVFSLIEIRNTGDVIPNVM